MIESLAKTPPMGRLIPTDASERKFGEAVLRYTLSGWYVVRQRSDLAELRKPKRFSFGWAAGWSAIGAIFTAIPGPWTILPAAYLVWHIVKKEKAVIVYVDADGDVKEAIPPDRM